MKVAVVVMGVLIVGGTVVLGVLLFTRVSAQSGAVASVLDEPVGTVIAGAALAPDRVALTLHGGGADRVVVVDMRNGRVVARVGLK